MPMLSRSLVYRQQVGWQRIKNEIKLLIESLRLQLKAGPIRNTPRRAEACSILPLPYMGVSKNRGTPKWTCLCFGTSENHSVIQLPKFARLYFCLYIRNGAGRSNVEQDNSQCSPRPRAILLSSYLWDHTKDSWIIMKVQEDRNTQKLDQYGTSFTIWLMGQGLFALDGEASSSRTSPCPVLWYIVRNSSHPQTRRQIWKAKPSSSTGCASRPSRAYHLIQVIVNLQDSYGRNVQAILRQGTAKQFLQSLQLYASTMYDWLRDHSYVHEGN